MDPEPDERYVGEEGGGGVSHACSGTGPLPLFPGQSSVCLPRQV